MPYYGIITGTDMGGNLKVSPNNGGRVVILRKSRGEKYGVGTRIEYEDLSPPKPGDDVDFANSYRLLRQTSTSTERNESGRRISKIFEEKLDDPLNLRETPSKIDDRRVKNELKSLNFDKFGSIVFYDPFQLITKQYPFVIVGRNEESVTQRRGIISPLIAPPFYHRKISVFYETKEAYGENWVLSEDFREKIPRWPKDKGIIALPIEGLASGRYAENKFISETNLRILVDNSSEFLI